jgi:hypothetical protein
MTTEPATHPLPPGTPPATITNIRPGLVQVRDALHITGGVRGWATREGWLLGPLPGNGGSNVVIGPVTESGIEAICRELGLAAFGKDQISQTDPLLPARVWMPILGPPELAHQPADTWAWIVAAAHAAGDNEYGMLARKVSFSLRAAGVRLRDASDEYHRQLTAALARKQAAGRRFRNTSMTDLHLAFHSLLSEMGSVRDYLAAVAARRVQAPPRIDAMTRLAGWALKPAGRTAIPDPLVAAMLDGWDETRPDPWLYELGEYRNQFLHREPLGTNQEARWLSLAERLSGNRRVMVMQMRIQSPPGSAQLCDALDRFADLHARMCRLADFAATHAKYPPQVTSFVMLQPSPPSSNYARKETV